LKTTNSLLETAVNLLRQCVVDDNKIVPQEWTIFLTYKIRK
jgi:hypothetical protein